MRTFRAGYRIYVTLNHTFYLMCTLNIWNCLMCKFNKQIIECRFNNPNYGIYTQQPLFIGSTYPIQNPKYGIYSSICIRVPCLSRNHQYYIAILLYIAMGRYRKIADSRTFSNTYDIVNRF